MDADHHQTAATQARAVAETADSAALLRGLLHGVFLSALIWAAIGWTLTLLR